MVYGNSHLSLRFFCKPKTLLKNRQPLDYPLLLLRMILRKSGSLAHSTQRVSGPFIFTPGCTRNAWPQAQRLLETRSSAATQRAF